MNKKITHPGFTRIKLYSQGTHEANGAVVYKRGNQAFIYDQRMTRLLKKIKYTRCWFGKDLTKTNSILFQLSKNSYMVVCSLITTFKTAKHDTIKTYHSSYHSSLYPGVVCVGEKYVYFPEEEKYSEKSSFTDFPSKHSWKEDAHSKLWGINDFKPIQSKKLTVKKAWIPGTSYPYKK